MADEKKEPKRKGKGEDYYLETYPGTGLVEGSLVDIEHDEMPEAGDILESGHEVTDADRSQFERIVPKGQKALMQRECSETGETFWLATSDVHQCRFSVEVRAKKAKEKSKARRATKRADEKAELKALRKENATLKGEEETEAVA